MSPEHPHLSQVAKTRHPKPKQWSTARGQVWSHYRVTLANLRASGEVVPFASSCLWTDFHLFNEDTFVQTLGVPSPASRNNALTAYEKSHLIFPQLPCFLKAP